MPSLLAFNAIPLTQITLGQAAISTNYALVGTFSSSLEIMYITSTLDSAVILSFDGINNHLTIPAGSTTPICIPINFKSNRLTLPKPSIYVKSTGAVSAGNIYISGFSA